MFRVPRDNGWNNDFSDRLPVPSQCRYALRIEKEAFIDWLEPHDQPPSANGFSLSFCSRSRRWARSISGVMSLRYLVHDYFVSTPVRKGKSSLWRWTRCASLIVFSVQSFCRRCSVPRFILVINVSFVRHSDTALSANINHSLSSISMCHLSVRVAARIGKERDVQVSFSLSRPAKDFFRSWPSGPLPWKSWFMTSEARNWCI